MGLGQSVAQRGHDAGELGVEGGGSEVADGVKDAQSSDLACPLGFLEGADDHREDAAGAVVAAAAQARDDALDGGLADRRSAVSEERQQERDGAGGLGLKGAAEVEAEGPEDERGAFAVVLLLLVLGGRLEARPEPEGLHGARALHGDQGGDAHGAADAQRGVVGNAARGVTHELLEGRCKLLL